MKITELINELIRLAIEEGDIEVRTFDFNSNIQPVTKVECQNDGYPKHGDYIFISSRK